MILEYVELNKGPFKLIWYKEMTEKVKRLKRFMNYTGFILFMSD